MRELLLGPKRFTDLRAGLPHVGPEDHLPTDAERAGSTFPAHWDDRRGYTHSNTYGNGRGLAYGNPDLRTRMAE